MKVNPTLLKTIEQSGLPVEEALLFCAAAEMQQYGTLDWLVINSGIISPDNEYKYRINLCFHDAETDTIALRYPLFIIENQGNYADFMKLLATRGIRHNGHPNNPRDYSIVGSGDEDAFAALQQKIKNLDIERLATVTVSYYANTTYAKKLADFLTGIAPAMYATFEENKSGMI